jgi:cellobiose transport system permease protein
LQVALVQLRGICQTDFATVMAGTLLSTIPLVVIFILGSSSSSAMSPPVR